MGMKPHVTQNELKLLLHYDPITGIFRWRIATGRVKVGDIAGVVWSRRDVLWKRSNSCSYIEIRIHGHRHGAHRLAWLYVHGDWPSVVDHKDGDGTNNAILNLRATTNAGNRKNVKRPIHNTSGFTGVSWHKRIEKWRVRIKVDGKAVDLGTYIDFDEAVQVRIAANKKYGFTGRQETPIGMRAINRVNLPHNNRAEKKKMKKTLEDAKLAALT